VARREATSWLTLEVALAGDFSRARPAPASTAIRRSRIPGVHLDAVAVLDGGTAWPHHL